MVLGSSIPIRKPLLQRFEGYLWWFNILRICSEYLKFLYFGTEQKSFTDSECLLRMAKFPPLKAFPLIF